MLNIPPFWHSAVPRRQDDDAIRRCSWPGTTGWVSPTPFIQLLFIQLFVWVRQLRWNFDGGRPSAAGHPTWHNQPDLSPELAATCLAQQTGCSHAACNSVFLAVCIGEWRRRLDAVVAYSRMAAYWAHVQIIFKHWFHDEIRPGFIMWLWFCSVFKRHELLPSVIWNRDSYSPDGATVVHN